MIRLAGILTGSAMAVAFLFVALGLPKFKAEPAVPTEAPPVEQESPPPDVAAVAALEATIEPPVEAEPIAASQPPVQEALAPAPIQTIEENPAPLEGSETNTPAGAEPSTESQWYAFWSPFRSELAAEGFVAELQRTTGLDYRVVKQKPGVYEVAFAYSDDADVENKLAQISSATGLDLSGG